MYKWNIQKNHIYLPVYPGAQEHWYLSMDSDNKQVPPFIHGRRSQEFAMGISHKDALKPKGQKHLKLGDPPADMLT